MVKFTTSVIPIFCWLFCCEQLPLATVKACPYMNKTNQRRNGSDHDVRPDHSQRKKEPDQQQRELQTNTSTTTLTGMIEFLLDDIMRIIASLLPETSEATPSAATEATPDTTIQSSIAAAKNDIQDILSDDLSNELVRLSFHDCVGVCDGCVDTSNPENFGLDSPIEDMENIVEQYADVLTRADLWVLGAYTALERQQNNGGVSFDLEYVGRPSCNEPTRGPDRQLPSAHLTTQGLIDYFRDQFDFDERETTAIMGAHTLGRAVPENSGFNGQGGWVPQEDNLNNQFYTVLLGNGATFRQQLQDNSNLENFPDQFLWRRSGEGGGNGGGNRRDLQRGGGNLFMLNADMALVADMEDFIDSESGAVSCTLGGSCPDSELLGFATEFARSNTAWIGAFHDAYIKMTNIGCEGVCRAI